MYVKKHPSATYAKNSLQKLACGIIWTSSTPRSARLIHALSAVPHARYTRNPNAAPSTRMDPTLALGAFGGGGALVWGALVWGVVLDCKGLELGVVELTGVELYEFRGELIGLLGSSVVRE